MVMRTTNLQNTSWENSKLPKYKIQGAKRAKCYPPAVSIRIVLVQNIKQNGTYIYGHKSGVSCDEISAYVRRPSLLFQRGDDGTHRCPAMCMVNVIDAAPPMPWSVSGTTPSLANASRSHSLEDTSNVFVDVHEKRCRDTPSTLPWFLKASPPNTKPQARWRLIAVRAHMSPSGSFSRKDWLCPGLRELRRRAPPLLRPKPSPVAEALPSTTVPK